MTLKEISYPRTCRISMKKTGRTFFLFLNVVLDAKPGGNVDFQLLRFPYKLEVKRNHVPHVLLQSLPACLLHIRDPEHVFEKDIDFVSQIKILFFFFSQVQKSLRLGIPYLHND